MSRTVEHTKIMVNDFFYCRTENIKQTLEALLLLGSDQLKYMSEDAIKDRIYGTLDLIEEALEWKKNIHMKKKIASCRKYLPNVNTREGAMMFYTNMMLSCAGLGTLTGFGLANTESKGGRMKSKGRILINPEKRTMRE